MYGYEFDVLQRDIEFNARTAADSWQKNKKKCQNKIKRLEKEIKDLQESADCYEKTENSYRETYNAAVEYREELREIFDEAN